MNDAPWDPVAAVAALRTPGTTPYDAVRLHYLEALARRAKGFDGEVKNLLDGKLHQALARYQSVHTQPCVTGSPSLGRPSALAELTRRLAQQPQNTETLVGGRAAVVNARPELKSVRDFRATWTQLSVEKQLTQALAQAPENAGPLNSHQLVLRALSVMRDTAPDYLNRFMSYVDALLWLDQADSQPVAASAVAGDAAKKRKTSRPRSK